MCSTCGCKGAETFEAKQIGSIRIAKNPNFPSGTSLQAYIKTNRAELRKLFGNPNMGASGDGKSKGKEWNLVVGSHRVTIYDKREKDKKGTKYFNIGGRGKFGALLVAQALSIHRNERVYAKETVPQWLEDERQYQRVKSIDEHPDLTYERAMEYHNNRGRYGAETFNVEFNEWADQEMMSHGKDISFKDWAEDEGLKHGDVPITDWAEHEEESHDARYGAENDDSITQKMIYNMEQTLDSIWRCGDRDEVSIKHIYYSLGALADGRDWNTQTDYTSMNEQNKVKRKWKKIQAKRDELGIERFKKLIDSTKYKVGKWDLYSADEIYDKPEGFKYMRDGDVRTINVGDRDYRVTKVMPEEGETFTPYYHVRLNLSGIIAEIFKQGSTWTYYTNAELGFKVNQKFKNPMAALEDIKEKESRGEFGKGMKLAESFEADRYWDEPTDSFRETFGPTVEVREFPNSSSVYQNGKVVKKYRGDGHMIKSRSWAEGLRDNNFSAESNSNNKLIFGALLVGLLVPTLSAFLNSKKEK